MRTCRFDMLLGFLKKFCEKTAKKTAKIIEKNLRKRLKFILNAPATITVRRI